MALYSPFRTIGLITDKTPFILNRLGNENFITVATGNQFQVYRTDKLTVSLVSKVAPGEITSIAVRGHHTFVAVGNAVYQYNRAHLGGKVLEHDLAVKGIFVLGEILLSYDANNNLKVFNLKLGELISTISLLHKSSLSVISHPSTYLNKFLLGYADGHIELWNVKTSKLIYTFTSHTKLLNLSNASVECIEQSPSSDVVGLGFSSGDIVIMNLKVDSVLFHFKQKGAVKAISFRTDSLTSQFPYVLSGSDRGHIYTWSIGADEQGNAPTRATSKLVSTIAHAHHGSIVKLQFFPGEPVFLSASIDNSLIMWIFDNPDGTARKLKSREGHSCFPKRMKYFGDTSNNAQSGDAIYGILSGIVSADADGRILFTRQEKSYDFQEFSQASIDKKDFFSYSKLPSCIDFDFTYIGSKPWGNMVSIHEGKMDAYVWKVDDRAATKTVLKYPLDYTPITKPVASALSVSICGNFCVIGYDNGKICKFNTQSGQFRGSYDYKIDGSLSDRKITGLYIDVTNAVLVAANSAGKLVFFSFLNTQLLHFEELGHAVELIRGFRDSNFIAVGDCQHNVKIYDVYSYRLCRVFYTHHTAAFSELLFSPDCRYFLSSSFDGTIQVWDISTSRCVSWVKFDDPVSSMTFTSTGDLLVARQNRKDIMICIDRSLTEEFVFVGEPSSPVLISSSMVALSAQSESHHDLATEENKSDQRIEDQSMILENSVEGEMILSSVSKAYWHSLCQFELLRKRSQLIKPQVKISVPFFLNEPPTTAVQHAVDQVPNQGSRIIKSKNTNGIFRRSNLGLLLDDTSINSARIGTQPHHSLSVLSHFLEQSPSQIEVELRSLLNAIEIGDPLAAKDLKKLFIVFAQLLDDGKSFDVVQALLQRIFFIFAEPLRKPENDFGPSLVIVLNSMKKSNEKLQNLLEIALCLVKTSLNIPFN